MGSKNEKKSREMSSQDASLRECLAQKINVFKDIECTVCI